MHALAPAEMIGRICIDCYKHDRVVVVVVAVVFVCVLALSNLLHFNGKNRIKLWCNPYNLCCTQEINMDYINWTNSLI